MTSVVLTSGQRWELGQQIGKGGAGQVFAATCDDASGPHVIKLVLSKDEDSGVEREAFIGIGLLGQPNVLPVLDTGKTDTHLALLMPRAEKSLREAMKDAHGPIPETDALPILIDIARGLVSLSRAQVPFEDTPGVVHRDLKAENVLLLDGAWCISDFGIARALNRGTAYDTRRYFMTHEYAAPEQWRGETATSQTDVYAFGIIAFELLMGYQPFRGSDLRKQHLESEPPIVSNVSRWLATLVAECLYKHAGTRPSPDRLLKRLEDESTRPGSERAAPVTGGMSALQAANLAETSRLGQEEWHAQLERESIERRAMLLGTATGQWRQLSSQLKDLILEHAPTCRFAEIGREGWSIDLSGASIVLRDAQEDEPKNWLPYELPFEVIAHCDISVYGNQFNINLSSFRKTRVSRSHSLWFCDAQVQDQFHWYELAFYNFGTDGRRQKAQPFSISPDGASRSSELRLYSHGAGLYDHGEEEYKLAWPFTPLVTGELDDFLDRWATWFAQASQGLPYSYSPVSDSGGSWRKS